MELGAFSVSLSVADVKASIDFYRKLGFQPIPNAGDGEHWQMLRNGTTTIGLFHGMFEGNILTFNPGWNAENEQLEAFTDIRELRSAVAEGGVEVTSDTTGESDTGPASFAFTDPDGNAILIDQHV